ncbi:DNA-binding protein [Nocardiopsis ansamitocini]|uniref:DNA-binding protein n=1 Tax=Nocardiopsis ansamitocini TaxID=1670832 RepID=A0A9W6P3G4_9ACTN|nr:DNA-binding protein [Nocardiopsis ansamitocini]
MQAALTDLSPTAPAPAPEPFPPPHELDALPAPPYALRPAQQGGRRRRLSPAPSSPGSSGSTGRRRRNDTPTSDEQGQAPPMDALPRRSRVRERIAASPPEGRDTTGSVPSGTAEPPPGYLEVREPTARTGALAGLTDRFLGEDGERPVLTSAGVKALAGVCATAVALTCWLVLRDRPDPVPAPVLRADSSPVPSPEETSSEQTADEAGTGEVVVHVGGEVESPGVLTLPSGSRVADAIEAAGGIAPDADPGLLNLARPLVDGEQVLVAVTPSPGVPLPPDPVPPGMPPLLLDLNSAGPTELETLPGVGPVLAQRIIDHRTTNGGFTSVEQLRDVTGIGDRRFEELKDAVRVGATP